MSTERMNDADLTKPRETPDHEFPHIVNVDGEHLRCVCGATCDLSAWLTWLPKHGNECRPASQMEASNAIWRSGRRGGWIK